MAQVEKLIKSFTDKFPELDKVTWIGADNDTVQTKEAIAKEWPNCNADAEVAIQAAFAPLVANHGSLLKDVAAHRNTAESITQSALTAYVGNASSKLVGSFPQDFEEWALDPKSVIGDMETLIGKSNMYICGSALLNCIFVKQKNTKKFPPAKLSQSLETNLAAVDEMYPDSNPMPLSLKPLYDECRRIHATLA